jgi:hypothetical protein
VGLEAEVSVVGGISCGQGLALRGFHLLKGHLWGSGCLGHILCIPPNCNLPKA